MKQCGWYGSQIVIVMGRSIKRQIRCQERGIDFWMDEETIDRYCPKHEQAIKRKR